MPLNVLIVSEDNVFITITHRLLLNQFGLVHISKCWSFDDVKALDLSKEYDVVLLDSPIVGSAKYELISYLRGELKVISPILFFTNNKVDEYDAMRVGATNVLGKPIVPSELKEQVSTLTISQ